MTSMVGQAVIVDQEKINQNQEVLQVAFFNSDGSPVSGGVGGGSTSLIITVDDATDVVEKTTTSPEPPIDSVFIIKFTYGNSADLPTISFASGEARSFKTNGLLASGSMFSPLSNVPVPCIFDGVDVHVIGTYYPPIPA